MRKLFLVLVLLFTAGSIAMAQEYKASTWASWASVTSQINWTFPYNSRDIAIFNGSTTKAICVTLANNITIDAGCTSTGTNGVFQIAPSTREYLRDITRQQISIKSVDGAAASPVSVLVTY